MKRILIFALFTFGLTAVFGCQKGEQAPPPAQLDTVLTVRYFGADGKTALELLETMHRVEKKTSSVGSFVESIDGVKNRRDRFWLYYVNGKMPDLASDRYQTKTGDTIEWKFEKEYGEVK